VLIPFLQLFINLSSISKTNNTYPYGSGLLVLFCIEETGALALGPSLVAGLLPKDTQALLSWEESRGLKALKRGVDGFRFSKFPQQTQNKITL